jgi:hypothetical protein
LLGRGRERQQQTEEHPINRGDGLGEHVHIGVNHRQEPRQAYGQAECHVRLSLCELSQNGPRCSEEHENIGDQERNQDWKPRVDRHLQVRVVRVVQRALTVLIQESVLLIDDLQELLLAETDAR